jgi:hypothetical protein
MDDGPTMDGWMRKVDQGERTKGGLSGKMRVNSRDLMKWRRST